MGAINDVLDYVASRLPPQWFPTAGRTFLETIQGNRAPITEKNFTPEELKVIARLTQSTGNRGNVQYPDYTKYGVAQHQAGGPLSMSLQPSIISPLDALGNVQTTLGQFLHSKDLEGNTIVTDNYDFNPPPESASADLIGASAMLSPYAAIRTYAGQKIPPGSGRPVTVNLGPLRPGGPRQDDM